jgi:hypothetical protein
MKVDTSPIPPEARVPNQIGKLRPTSPAAELTNEFSWQMSADSLLTGENALLVAAQSVRCGVIARIAGRSRR